jgi:hypothetical protein
VPFCTNAKLRRHCGEKKKIQMKKIFAIAFLFITYAATAQHSLPANEDRPATHGMLIFGTNKIYASHLPMFHSPHNYQVILELDLDGIAKQKFVTDQNSHPQFTAYTIEPEKFILPEMIANPKPFTANIYRGHFERGGMMIAENISVKIKQVIYFEKFDRGESKSPDADFILFGNIKEQFAAHHITNKPDFDQIIQVQTDTALINEHAAFKTVTFKSADNTPAGISGNAIEIADGEKKISIILLKQLYLEFDDLKE